MPHIFADDIHAIEPEDSLSYLKEVPSYTPTNDTWVRLKRHPYRGDLAFVCDVDPLNLSAHLILIPRIDLSPKSALKGKRKRGSRPLQALFNPFAVAEVYGQKSVEKRNNIFLFKGKTYRDGWLDFSVEDANLTEATPTREELLQFGTCPSIPHDVIKKHLDILSAQSLRPGDSVKITSGNSSGLLAKVCECRGDEVDVLIQRHISLTLPASALRRHFEIGDSVIVSLGDSSGSTGIVISVLETQVTIWNMDLANEVNLKLI